MADGVFNIAKGRIVEKIADSAAAIGIMLLKTAQADATLIDSDTIAALLAAGGGTANVECDFTNYARKTGLTGSITVDDTNDRVDVDVADQTWTAAGGTADNDIVKLVTFYQESAADSGRIPLTHHDFTVSTDGSDVQAVVNASGFHRAA